MNEVNTGSRSRSVGGEVLIPTRPLDDATVATALYEVQAGLCEELV